MFRLLPKVQTFIFYLLLLQLVLCRVAAVKSLPVHHPKCRFYFYLGPLRSVKIFRVFKTLTFIVKTENEKRRFVMKVQAFCEEKGLRSFLGVFGYAESKNQCWQAEKWLLHHLICIFPRWPPKLRKTSIAANLYMFRIPNCYKIIKITF